ncbi:hypothetical protein SeLEV6574_g07884 [Synchytrium endobioticum]|uniref:Uncharacterized protein n=1 Tax=Synchytrium endobioticum TaxID=286115 RepID=A0A507CHB0_9FUNG|nr:hypothetical protein SeLEV6574_g07884 [Synchytrium endobioticum]
MLCARLESNNWFEITIKNIHREDGIPTIRIFGMISCKAINKCFVEAFDQSIGLGIICSSNFMIHLQSYAKAIHHVIRKLCALIGCGPTRSTETFAKGPSGCVGCNGLL